MSEQQLGAFLAQIKADAGLQEKLNGADADSVIAIAKEAGFMISAEDTKAIGMQISEEELESGSVGGAAFSMVSLCLYDCPF